MKPPRRWRRLSRLAAFAGLVKWLLFGGPAGCALSFASPGEQCRAIADAVSTKLSTCRLSAHIGGDCDTAGYVNGDVGACLAAVRGAACTTDAIGAAYRDNCNVIYSLPWE